MPCNSDHMNPTQYEKELSKIQCILDELGGHAYSKDAWAGYHKDVYSTHISKERMDQATADLCGRLSKMSNRKIKTMSLEAQMWWRDHQEADKWRLGTA